MKRLPGLDHSHKNVIKLVKRGFLMIGLSSYDVDVISYAIDVAQQDISKFSRQQFSYKRFKCIEIKNTWETWKTQKHSTD